MLSSTSIAKQFGGERETEQPITLRAGHQGATESAEVESAIDCAYKHVYGNGHVMDHETLEGCSNRCKGWMARVWCSYLMIMAQEKIKTIKNSLKP